MSTRLVVEWTRASVRMALADIRGAHGRVRAIREKAIAGGEVSEALRELVRGTRAAAVEVIAVISREHVITRVVKFPTMQPEEL